MEAAPIRREARSAEHGNSTPSARHIGCRCRWSIQQAFQKWRARHRLKFLRNIEDTQLLWLHGIGNAANCLALSIGRAGERNDLASRQRPWRKLNQTKLVLLRPQSRCRRNVRGYRGKQRRRLWRMSAFTAEPSSSAGLSSSASLDWSTISGGTSPPSAAILSVDYDPSKQLSFRWLNIQLGRSPAGSSGGNGNAW